MLRVFDTLAQPEAVSLIAQCPEVVNATEIAFEVGLPLVKLQPEAGVICHKQVIPIVHSAIPWELFEMVPIMGVVDVHVTGCVRPVHLVESGSLNGDMVKPVWGFSLISTGSICELEDPQGLDITHLIP